MDFYPRSPCGERPPCSRSEKQKRLISIHALLAESDAPFSTALRPAANISIHALLAESDLPLGACLDNKQTFLSTLSLRRATEPPGPCRCGRPHFYPRSPCGERPINQWYSANLAQISIHALLAESDLKAFSSIVDVFAISIHALLAESDNLSNHQSVNYTLISIHALLAESDPDPSAG